MKTKKFTPTYSLMAVMMASATDPMPEFMRNHHITLMTNALNAIVSGTDASQNDWRHRLHDTRPAPRPGSAIRRTNPPANP